MRKLFTNKNKKGFAMAELLAVSIVLLFIFSILFSNYLPLVAEYETRLSYNDVTAQYAAHYIRKMYKEALDDTTVIPGTGSTKGDQLKSTISTGISARGYFTVYSGNSDDQIFSQVSEQENCERIIKQYGIEEIIITNYKLKDDKDTTATTKYVKGNYKKDSGSLYNYIKYLPNYNKSIYTGNNLPTDSIQLYRIILKTKDYGYATTPILSDYRTPDSCFIFENNANGKTITDYLFDEDNGCGKMVIIKSTPIDGKYITKIGDNAFRNDPIESVQFSDNIDSIGISAFEATNLKEFNIPTRVETIGSRAFANTDIKEITLSSGIAIGDYAFADNKNLLTVQLPSADIYTSDVGENGQKILTKGLFARCGTEAKTPDGKSSAIEVNIPNEMKNVGDEMFYLAKIKSITLTDGVETIGEKAFSQKKPDNNPTDYKVATLTIPASVKKIGIESFEMLGITTLNLIDGNIDLKILGGAFKGNNINDVTIPSRVSEIGNSAFEASKIKNLIFNGNDKISSIPLKAFYNNNINSVTIPNSVTSIGESAFELNPDLSILTLPSNLLTIGIRSFYGTGLTNVTIPGTVKKIWSSAFQKSNLTEVIFSTGSVSLVIQDSVFQDNPLKTFTIPERVSSIGNNIFSGIGADAKIYNWSTTLNNTNWCDKFAANNTCELVGPDSENKFKIEYTIKGITNTRYVYNMGGTTNG